MSTVQIPDYKTDPFLVWKISGIETAEGELTHYHEVGEGTPILFYMVQELVSLLLQTGG